jgi:hypothetical protein
MMCKIAGVAVGLMLLAIPEIATGQLGYLWSFDERTSQAGLVVIAARGLTRETIIRTTIGEMEPAFPVIEMRTEFKIDVVLKGVPDSSTIVLCHYRRDRERLGTGGVVNGPHPLNFATTAQLTLSYLLFLKHDVDGLFVPVTGQVFPEESVFVLRRTD